MKAMPLPFKEFQGKGALNFSSSTSSCSDSSLLLQNQHRRHQQREEEKWQNNKEGCCYVGSEPTSVLDTRRSPSSPTSSSTLSSSLCVSGGGGGSGASTDTTGVAETTAVSGNNNHNNNNNSQSVDIGTEKCGLGMEDWESVLSDSPSQEQSILRLIMSDIEDPSMGLNKILPPGGGSQDMEFNAGFGLVDQGFAFESITGGGNLISNDIDSPLAGSCSDFAKLGAVSSPPNPVFSSLPPNLLPAQLSPGVFPQQQLQPLEALYQKPQVFNPQMIINQNQAQFAQNPAMFLPLSYAQMPEHHFLSPSPPKRLNSGPSGPNYQVPKVPFSGSGQELYLLRQQQQLQMLQQRPTTIGMAATAKPKVVNDELANQQLQQAIIEQLIQAAELIETGNPVLAQGILARLNHQLSPVGKPFVRAAFYFKEALQLLLRLITSNNASALSTYNMIFKIGAYKSFSETPIVQFANFTCNQALLEVFEGCSRIHIIDFDIGYGGQWASLMQELVLRNGGAPALKITAFASPSTHDELELGFTQENLKHFASEINMAVDIEILSLESLNSGSWPMQMHLPENEAIAVNLPIGSFSNCPSTLPLVLRFVKQLSPKIVVSLDRGCDRTDVSFPHHIIHAIQSYSGLLESLDAVNMNLDALQKIERFLLQPGIEKIVLGRHRSLERIAPWRSLFIQSGFTPLTFSNFTESQAECLIQRTPSGGFHVEKRQSSLVLCWQRRELIAASAWRC